MEVLPFDLLKKDLSPVIESSISLSEYYPIDLSVSNVALQHVNAASSDDWEEFITDYLAKYGKRVAYGGYLEERNIYQRSAYFKNEANNRNIHLGVDLWVEAGTRVHAICEGHIHSFQDNTNYGDYGPTIVLEHTYSKGKWFTLYGHLSRASLNGIRVGQKVDKGACIGTLGDASVNGDYAPHLHFQVIRDLEGRKGDYPGVCSKQEVDKFSANCPNPLPLLNLD
jgi:murein DD-endopeptidase MepM/ murein hydrolase activator NlpD